MEHHYEAEDFDLPSVHTIDTVEGVEKFDPALGGEPINGWPEPYEKLSLSFVEERKPKPKKKKATKGKGKKDDDSSED